MSLPLARYSLVSMLSARILPFVPVIPFALVFAGCSKRTLPEAKLGGAASVVTIERSSGDVDACSAQIIERPKDSTDDGVSFAGDWKTICESIKDLGASPVIDDTRVMLDDLDCASFKAPSGKGPWTIGLEFRGGGGALQSSGSIYVHRTKDGFFVLSHMDSTDDNGPLYTRECPLHISSFEAKQEGNVVVTRTTEDATNDGTCPNTPPDCICDVDGTNDTTTYYDLRTGAKLLKILHFKRPSTPTLKTTITGDKLKISGGACDRLIDLAALRGKPQSAPR